MLLLKKIGGELASPLSILVLLALIGLALLWFSRRQRTAKVFVTAAFLLLISAAYGWLGGPALRSLERSYAPLAKAPADTKWIVVLGSGTSSDPSLPLFDRLTSASLARVTEGVRLHRQVPGAKLLVSGAPLFGYGGDGEAMAAMAAALGVPADAIVVDRLSPDTESQARNIRGIVKGERALLVTSAAHMPRSLLLFRRAGMTPLPAPTHYLSQENTGISPSDFFPNAVHLTRAESAMHEYLGIAWARLAARF